MRDFFRSLMLLTALPTFSNHAAELNRVCDYSHYETQSMSPHISENSRDVESVVLQQEQYNKLLTVSRQGNVQGLRELLKKYPDLDINYSNSHGNTALMLAACYGNLEIVKMLLSDKAICLDAQNNQGYNALMLASIQGHGAVVKLLLSFPKGQEQINSQDRLGRSALLLSVINGQRDIIEILLSYELIDVNQQDQWGNTALLFAAHYGYTDIVTRLLENNTINVSLQNNKGENALIIATSLRHKNIVKLLLAHSSAQDINTQDASGLTAFMVACLASDEGIIDLFIATDKVNFNMTDNMGNSAIFMIVPYNNFLLTDKILSTKKVELNISNNKGMTPIMFASWYGYCDLVKLMLAYAPNQDINKKNIYGNSALALAAANGHEDTVHFLIKIKADIAATNNQKMTPLMIAARAGYSHVVKILLAKNSEYEYINTADNDGYTAFIHAALQGHEEVIQDLLATGKVDLHHKTHNGDTALILASANDDAHLIKLILDSPLVDSQKIDEEKAIAIKIALNLKKQSAAIALLKHRNKS